MPVFSVSGVTELVDAIKGVSTSLSHAVSQSYRDHMEVLAMVGASYVVWKGLRILCGCYRLVQWQILPRLFSNSSVIRQYGEWAVVTGASSGIGRAYAEELASHGVNIILLGRNGDNLQKVSEVITATYGVKTRLIVADFNKGPEVFPSIKKALQDVDVGILCNNAGACYEYPARLADVPEEKSLEIINVNIAASVMMVYVVLPGMLQRKRGAIINVASLVCYRPVPQLAVYAASKAFLDSFTRSLQYEYGPQGIFIQSLSPGFVVTKMVAFAECFSKKTISSPLAREYAHSAVRTIGGPLRTTGYWSHSILISVGCWIPECLWMYLWNCLGSKFRAKHLLKRKSR